MCFFVGGGYHIHIYIYYMYTHKHRCTQHAAIYVYLDVIVWLKRFSAALHNAPVFRHSVSRSVFSLRYPV